MKKLSVVVISILMTSLFVFAACNKPDGYENTKKYTAIYEVLPDEYVDLDARVDNTISSIKSLLLSNGVIWSSVTQGKSSNGNTAILVKITDVEDYKRVLELIGRPASLEFKAEDSASAENLIVGREHLENVYITRDSNDNYAIGLKFNAVGAEKFAQATSDYLNKSIYIYIDGERYTSVNVNSQITNGETIITSGSTGYTYLEAHDFVIRLQAGAFGVSIRQTEAGIEIE